MSNETKIKESNPKDTIGCTKPSLSVLPLLTLSKAGVRFGKYHSKVFYLLALGMYEGARKYGRHNYRTIGVRASIYYDAAMRHFAKHAEGEDIDQDSGLPHVLKAATSMLVLFDAIQFNNWHDDRPPSMHATEQGCVAFEHETPLELLTRWWEGDSEKFLRYALAGTLDWYVSNMPKPGADWFDSIQKDWDIVTAKYPSPKEPWTQCRITHEREEQTAIYKRFVADLFDTAPSVEPEYITELPDAEPAHGGARLGGKEVLKRASLGALDVLPYTSPYSNNLYCPACDAVLGKPVRNHSEETILYSCVCGYSKLKADI